MLKHHLGFDNMNKYELTDLNKVVEVRKKLQHEASRNISRAGNFNQCQDSMNSDTVSRYNKWNKDQSTKLNFPLNP